MKVKQKIDIILSTYNNGTFTCSDVVKLGFSKSILSKMIDMKIIERVERGVYKKCDVFFDREYILQSRYSCVVFSSYTSLYLLGYIEEPKDDIYITVKEGYNTKSLERDNIHITRCKKENFEIGITNNLSYSGNTCLTYDIERTICDMLHHRKYDKQTVVGVMKKYCNSKIYNETKLKEYAVKLRVWNKLEDLLLLIRCI